MSPLAWLFGNRKPIFRILPLANQSNITALLYRRVPFASILSGALQMWSYGYDNDLVEVI